MVMGAGEQPGGAQLVQLGGFTTGFLTTTPVMTAAVSSTTQSERTDKQRFVPPKQWATTQNDCNQPQVI